VTGLEVASIMDGYNAMKIVDRNWTVPAEYTKLNVSDTVINILLGNHAA
jgi:hypothetical protein